MKRFLLLTTCLLSTHAAFAQTAPLPAYQECTTLATTNPSAALIKADAWLRIDNGVPAQHCRAMALYGLRRFAEAADALAAVRDAISRDNAAMRSYITRQAARAMVNANQADRGLGLLSSQIDEMSNVRGDNAATARQTSELLLERARLNANYGKLNDATKDLDHAVSLTPISEEVLMERASVFEKLGDRALAQSDAEIVRKLNPDNAQAKAMLTRFGVLTPSVGLQAPTSPSATANEPAPVKRKWKKKATKPAVKPSVEAEAEAAPAPAASESAAAAAAAAAATPPAPPAPPPPVAAAKPTAVAPALPALPATAPAAPAPAPAAAPSGLPPLPPALPVIDKRAP